MKPYIRFCSCQLNAAALLQRLTENSSQFREIHKVGIHLSLLIYPKYCNTLTLYHTFPNI